MEFILNLIYLPVCAFCGEINYNFLCKKCENKLRKIEKIKVEKYKNKYYNEHIYLYKYQDIRNEILKYKFNNKAYYHKSFSKIIVNNKKMCKILKSYDIIIPVPIHKKRRKERGYNQAELIAKEISKNILSLKYLDVLKKEKNTVAQSTLNKKERLNNLKNVYKIKDITINELENKKVLIFDDIYTTGTTANECAKVIKVLNPEKIGILTIAKD